MKRDTEYGLTETNRCELNNPGRRGHEGAVACERKSCKGEQSYSRHISPRGWGGEGKEYRRSPMGSRMSACLGFNTLEGLTDCDSEKVISFPSVFLAIYLQDGKFPKNFV